MCEIKTLSAILIAIYRPPGAPEQSFEKLLKFIQNYLNNVSTDENQCDIFITGDFNFPNIQWPISENLSPKQKLCSSASLLLRFMEENFLTQYIDKPTRENNILELFMTNNCNLVSHVDSIDSYLSDHNIVKVNTTYNLLKPQVIAQPKVQFHSFRNLNLKKANFSDISKQLKEINWKELKDLCTPDEFPELFRLTLLQVTMLHSPCKTAPSKKTNPFVRARYILRRRKRKVRAQVNAMVNNTPTNNAEITNKLRKLRLEMYNLNEAIKDSVHEEEKSKESSAVKNIKDNPKFFYSYAKKKNKLKSTVGPLFNTLGELTHDPEEMSNILQNQYASVFSDPDSKQKKRHKIEFKLKSILTNFEFTTKDLEKAIDEIDQNSSCGPNDIPALLLKNCKKELSHPLLLIWRDSLNHGYVPKIYKNQIITPVHKKASKADPENYRPISLTSHVIKIFERVVRVHIVKHLEKNQIICPNQHGFQKFKSCLTQLLPHLDHIFQNLLNNMDTEVIYLDYAKAFDKVDHQLLLQKLYDYGIRGKLLMWLHSYLTNRWQTVVVNGQHSYKAKVKSGVPQGTVLGPVLFIIYLNDLQSCIKHSITSSFADDTRLKKSINTIDDCQLLQEDLASAIKWSEEANMALHQSKFELLAHNTDNSKLLQELPFTKDISKYITSDGSSIYPKDAVKDLGLIITPDLSWSTHIAKITEDSRKMASWILSVFYERTAEVLLPLYKSIVRSRAEYLCPAWNPSKVEDIMKLESVQRTFTSRIREVRHLPYWERLKELNIMSLQRRRERYIIIHVFKIYNQLAPNDLQMSFYYNERRGVCCNIPPIVKSSKQKYQSQYDASFRVTGAKLWNLLPKAIKNKPTLESFKAALTKYITSLPDEPPIPGQPNDNSLTTQLKISWRNPTYGGQTPSEEADNLLACRD